jgi:AbiV family abortive infection protein
VEILGAIRILKCKEVVRKVPIARMQEGIDLCMKNAADYLLDARMIANEGRLNHALVSAEFAIEELGKMLLLKAHLKEGSNIVEIDGEQFCDHDKKADKAWNEVLDKEYRMLYTVWLDNKRWDDTSVWDEKPTKISNVTRLDCGFVDFINNNWTCEKPIDPDLFKLF